MKKYFSSYAYVFIISFVYFVLLYLSSFIKGYGYFIDEFYYIACANNPAAGYVDHPPLAPLILALYKSVFGDSVYALRLLPSLASSATVFMAGVLAKESGGGKTAAAAASFCVMASPVFPVFGGFFSMNVFEPLLCAFVFLYLIRMVRDNEPRMWLRLGMLFGVLMMNKHTAGLCILFLVVSLLLTPQRKLLFSRYFIYCVIIAAVIFLPNVIWQARNGFPSLEFYRANVSGKNVAVPYTEFIMMQILSYGPFAFLVAAAGIYALVLRNKNYRALAYIFILTFMFFLLTKNSRFDRTAFSYIAVIPAGAVWLTELIKRKRAVWVYPVAGAAMLAYSCILVPVFIPYFNYEKSAALTSFLGLNTEIERGNKPVLAQTLADRIGWEEKADIVGQVFSKLTEDEKKRTLVAGSNYGMAGALELYGKKYGFGDLVVCGHNNYYLWSREKLRGDILIQLSDTASFHGLEESFGTVEKTNLIFDNPYCTPHERNLTVFVCRYPKHTLEELLENGKYFY